MGAAAAELALAAAEISALVALRASAGAPDTVQGAGEHTRETLAVLQESEPFPGNDAEGETFDAKSEKSLRLQCLLLQFTTPRRCLCGFRWGTTTTT